MSTYGPLNQISGQSGQIPLELKPQPHTTLQEEKVLPLKHTVKLDSLTAQAEGIAMQVHPCSCLYFVCQSGDEYKRQGHPTSIRFYTVFQSNQYDPT